MEVILNNVRVSFPKVFKPESVNGGDPQFGGTFIIEPGSANAKALQAAVEKTATGKWADKAKGVLAKLAEEGRVCYHQKAKTNGEGEVYEGFEGMHWIGASNKARPLVVDRDLSPLTVEDGRPYGGCYVNAKLDLWAQDNSFGKRINATLLTVQFVKDGDAFSGAKAPTLDGFTALSDGADAEGFA